MDPLALLPLGSALLALVTGLRVLRPARRTALSVSTAGMMLSAAFWGVNGALAMIYAERPEVARGFLVALVPAAAVLVASGAWHTLGFTGRTWLWTRRTLVVLAVEPTVTLVLAATSGGHGLLVRLEPANPSGLAFGLGFWVHTAYCYVLLTAACVALLTSRRSAVRGHRRNHEIAAAIIALPFAANVYALATMPQRWVDTTSVALVVTALVWLWAERDTARMHQLPVPTADVIRAIEDGVLVLDASGRVIETNPAAEAMLARGGLEPSSLRLGQPLRDLVPRLVVVATESGQPVTLAGATFDVRTTEVRAGGTTTGTVVVIRDITEVATLRARLESQARTDALTGLANRHELERILADAVAATTAAGEPLSVAMVDIDRFKQVNDRHGHAAGDRVLVAVARVLREVPGAEAVRVGGEEFLLLLPGLHADEATRRLEAARMRCAALRVPGREEDLAVTVSAGVAELPPGGASEAAVLAADSALYEAKEAGRNRVLAAARA